MMAARFLIPIFILSSCAGSPLPTAKEIIGSWRYGGLTLTVKENSEYVYSSLNSTSEGKYKYNPKSGKLDLMDKNGIISGDLQFKSAYRDGKMTYAIEFGDSYMEKVNSEGK